MQYMRNYHECRKLIGLHLQLFAEKDSGVPQEGDDRKTTEVVTDGKKRSIEFDNFLMQRGNQAEFDRRVQKATQTAVNNARKKWDELAKREEAEYQANIQKRRGKICITLEY